MVWNGCQLIKYKIEMKYYSVIIGNYKLVCWRDCRNDWNYQILFFLLFLNGKVSIYILNYLSYLLVLFEFN